MPVVLRTWVLELPLWLPVVLMVLFLVSTVLEAVAELTLFLLEVLLFWVAVDLFCPDVLLETD